MAVLRLDRMLRRRHAAGDKLVVQCVATFLQVIGCRQLCQQVCGAQQCAQLPLLAAAHSQMFRLAMAVGEMHQPGAYGCHARQAYPRKLCANQCRSATNMGTRVRSTGAVSAVPAATKVAGVVKQRAGNPGQCEIGSKRPGTGPALFAPRHQTRHSQGDIQHVLRVVVAGITTVILRMLAGIELTEQPAQHIQCGPVSTRPVCLQNGAHFRHHSGHITQCHLAGDIAAGVVSRNYHADSVALLRFTLETIL